VQWSYIKKKKKKKGGKEGREKEEGTGGVAQMVEHLNAKLASPNHSSAKTKMMHGLLFMML
jgi:hypothetical protein